MEPKPIETALRDVAFTTTTPFEPDNLDVQYDYLGENIQKLEATGARLFIPCGNTGEYDSLTHSERINVVEKTVKVADDNSTVVAGAGGSTRTVVDLVNQYQSAGADAAMIMHPTHTYVHEQGLLRYYRNILEATDLPLVLYKQGPELTHQSIIELAKEENVVGIKYALNDIKSFSAETTSVDNGLVWVNGIAERFAPAFALEGAEGFTTGIGNFLPNPTLGLMDALNAGNLDQARSIRDSLRPLEDLREEAGEENNITAANNVPVVKYGMDYMGLHGGPVRPPLTELSAVDKERTERYIDEIQDAFNS